MKTAPRFFTALVALIVLLPLAARATEVDAVIAKARAAVGDEAALASIKSVHYAGNLETTVTDEKGHPKTVIVAIEIIFQKPSQQRIVATSADKIEITALDGYDAWQREQDPKDSARWRMTLLSKDQIERLRANAWENLFFYRGIERIGGQIEDLGTTEVDGKTCRKLCFNHGNGVLFYRYFDQQTGRLLLTETENGVLIKERDDIAVDGIKFPRKIVTESKLPTGLKRTVTIVFDKITVNETFADSLFTVPILGR
jgi:outer membrane lipoprotein-sorting protein